MRSQSFLILLQCLSFVLSLPHLPIQPDNAIVMRKCATESNSEIIAALELKFAHDWLNVVMSKDSTSSNPTTIQTHFHIIAANETEEGGWVPEPQLSEQLRVINDDFNSSGISFHPTTVERIINEEWFLNGGPETKVQDDMKQHLRKGGASDLNVYTVNFAGDWEGLLGYSTFPIMYNNNSIDDGIVILYSTVPGGATSHFNLGRTLTHELGHWLGLYHTFQNGCDNPGDYVSDTPDQATPTPGCPSSRDTCSSEGIDPIHNFMDYSDDSCMNNFTLNQAIRIKSQLITYRNITF